MAISLLQLHNLHFDSEFGLPQKQKLHREGYVTCDIPIGLHSCFEISSSSVLLSTSVALACTLVAVRPH